MIDDVKKLEPVDDVVEEDLNNFAKGHVFAPVFAADSEEEEEEERTNTPVHEAVKLFQV